MWQEKADTPLRQKAIGTAPAGAASLPLSFCERPAAFGLCLAILLCFLACSGCTLPREPAPSGRTASGAAISQTALTTIGTRYCYGGSSPAKGFDCSGLVLWAYGKNGLNVPRTANEQSRMGYAVSKGNLRPGDLVVFKTRSGLHTGIYTGKGRFVHSPRSGTSVREESIDSKYWRGRFIAGRRHAGVY